MNYLIKQEDLLDLKIEDNSDHYLFNSLLALGQVEPHSYLEEDPDNLSFFGKPNAQSPKEQDSCQTDIILNELRTLYNLRVTPLAELITYTEQYYSLSQKAKLRLVRALKRQKLSLKRENAKKRLPSTVKFEEIIDQEIKIEDNMASSIVFEDESQETKKKKRNRMSAQKSRDRKKEYIKQLEKINRDLNKKIEEISSKNIQRLNPASRDFLKVLLCLGITCFVNTAQTNCLHDTQVEEERPSSETISPYDAICLTSKLDLDNTKKRLPVQHQLLLDEALASMHPNHPKEFNLESSADSQCQIISKQKIVRKDSQQKSENSSSSSLRIS